MEEIRFCNCNEPQIDPYSGPYDFYCKLCGDSIAPEKPTYVSIKTPWYVVGVHTWGGTFNLPLPFALVYYTLFYPLYTLCVVIEKLNWWWGGLFNKYPYRRWSPPKAKHPKNLWN